MDVVVASYIVKLSVPKPLASFGLVEPRAGPHPLLQILSFRSDQLKLFLHELHVPLSNESSIAATRWFH